MYILHYGVGHDKGGHSGRYPWGSGKNPYGGKKKIGSMFHITAKTNLANTARTMEQNRYDKVGYKADEIARFVSQAYDNSEMAKKYREKGLGQQDFWLGSDNSPDRQKFLKDLLKKDSELQIDLKEYRRQRSDWDSEARDFIRRMGTEFDLKSLYSLNTKIDAATDFLKGFVERHYSPTENLSDIEELDRILGSYYW